MVEKIITGCTTKPDNIDKFSCKGPECPNTCCYGWNIDIDNASIELIKEELPEFKDKFLGNLRLKEVADNKGSKDKGLKKPKNKADKKENIIEKIIDEKLAPKYVMNLDEDGKCPFLTEIGLCGMQIEYGAKYLSSICRTYPRQATKCLISRHKTLSLSCSPVCKLFLDNNKPINFKKTYNSEVLSSTDNFEEYLNIIIHEKVIEMLQNKQINLINRMRLISIMTDKMSKVEKNNENLEEFENIMEFHNNKDNVDAYSTAFKNVPVSIQLREDFDIWLKAVFLTKNIKMSELQKDNFYFDYIKDFLEDEELKEFSKNRTKIWDKLFAEYGQLIENYFVMNFFNDFFPVGHENLEKASKYIVFRFNISLSFVSFIFRDKEHISEKDLIFAISYFERYFEHNAGRITMFNVFCEKYENLNMASTLTLFNL